MTISGLYGRLKGRLSGGRVQSVPGGSWSSLVGKSYRLDDEGKRRPPVRPDPPVLSERVQQYPSEVAYFKALGTAYKQALKASYNPQAGQLGKYACRSVFGEWSCRLEEHHSGLHLQVENCPWNDSDAEWFKCQMEM